MICDEWPGLDEFFEPEREVIVVRNAEDVVQAIRHYDARMRRQIASAFFEKAVKFHTYETRAEQAEDAFLKCLSSRKRRQAVVRQEADLLARGAA